jgi:LytS/YehU family sensor histidine kinase
MAENNHHPEIQESEYFELAALFIQIEDYPSASKYFHAGMQLDQPHAFSSWPAMVYAELLGRQHQFDSALYYYDHFDSAGATPAMLRTYLVSKGEFLARQGRSLTAMSYFDKSLVYQRQLNDRNQLMRCLKDMALACQQLNRGADAYRYAREGLAIAGQFKARQFIRDNCHILFTLYDAEGRTDSAYAYYRRYIIMKDSVNNEQLKGKFAAWSFEQQIAMLHNEKALQDVCIREEMLTKKILIGGLVVLLLFTFIFSRVILLKRKNEAHLRQRVENELEIQRLEGERAKSALQQRAKELEVQALRSQMNPHFIFNCLNAINRFILGHETEAASDYLTKFSRLMRMTMNHSRHALITLAEELEVLQLYLDMERLRFKNAFDYRIIAEGDLETGELYIPPLLLQPFVENAIWHGLMQKQERGELSITLRMSDMLTCIIQDNGIGRKKAGQLKSKSAEKHKSMGLQITAERLALMTGKDGSGHSFTIEDLYDGEGRPAGTRVILTIRVSLAVETQREEQEPFLKNKL